MEIFILRHGIAAERNGRRYPDDGLRPLTPEGRRKLHRIASFLRGQGYEFDLVLTSPLVRARQTAEVAVGILGIGKKLAETPHLSPGGDPRLLVQELRRSGRESVLLVGHEPYLSGFISMLLSGRGDISVELKKGGFCHLSAPSLEYGQCAVLISLLAPRQMISG